MILIVATQTLVTILILIDGFLQWYHMLDTDEYLKVTILILIDGFLQYLFTQRASRHLQWSQSLF